MLPALRPRRCALALLAAVVALSFSAVPRAGSETDPRYVALGDSYTAGQGEPPFEEGTDVPGNYCHRSLHSYPVQYAAGRFPYRSYACAGATTDDFFRGGRASDTPDGQIARVSPSTRLISLTVGGNDLGFTRLMRSCTYRNCTTDPEWSNLAQRIDGLAPKLRSVYDAVQDRAPQAAVFVLGYPAFLSNVDQVSFCNDDIGLSAQEKDWLNGHLDHLDRVIRAQAEAAGTTYVDVQNAFRGHEVCTLEPWSTGWNRDNWRWSYHPNRLGHQALAAALARYAG